MTVKAYKFLDEDGRSVYSGAQWPLSPSGKPGGWLESETVRPCYSGIHACRPSDIAYWLTDELWEVELDGEIVESRHKVVGTRGRILRRVAEYPVAVRELGEVSAWRTRDRAALALRAVGATELATKFEQCSALAQLASLAPIVEEQLDSTSDAGIAAMLATDAAGVVANDGPPQGAPFVSACAAGREAADFDAGYDAERQFQSAWLADRLRLV